MESRVAHRQVRALQVRALKESDPDRRKQFLLSKLGGAAIKMAVPPEISY